MITLNGRTGHNSNQVPAHVAEMQAATLARRQAAYANQERVTQLDIRYTDSQFRSFFAYVRQELPVRGYQLMKGAHNQLCVRGELSPAERAQLLEIVNAFEAMLQPVEPVTMQRPRKGRNRRQLQ